MLSTSRSAPKAPSTAVGVLRRPDRLSDRLFGNLAPDPTPRATAKTIGTWLYALGVKDLESAERLSARSRQSLLFRLGEAPVHAFDVVAVSFLKAESARAGNPEQGIPFGVLLNKNGNDLRQGDQSFMPDMVRRIQFCTVAAQKRNAHIGPRIGELGLELKRRLPVWPISERAAPSALESPTVEPQNLSLLLQVLIGCQILEDPAAILDVLKYASHPLLGVQKQEVVLRDLFGVLPAHVRAADCLAFCRAAITVKSPRLAECAVRAAVSQGLLADMLALGMTADETVDLVALSPDGALRASLILAAGNFGYDTETRAAATKSAPATSAPEPKAVSRLGFLHVVRSI